MKPLLKCPYPVDGWGWEMRNTLSILIAKRINQLRKSRKLSVNELATMSGLSYSTLINDINCSPCQIWNPYFCQSFMQESSITIIVCTEPQ